MGQPEIEVGKIDRDEDVRPGCRGVGHEPAVDRIRARQHARYLQESGDRETLKIGDEARASIAEPLAAEPGDDRRWIEIEQLARERAGVEVAGRFAAGDQDAHDSGARKRSDTRPTPELTVVGGRPVWTERRF
jgi:hypothetical protein